MADIGHLGDGGVVVGVDEVDVVGGPAHHEDGDNYSEHLHQLVKLFNLVIVSLPFTYSLFVLPAFNHCGVRWNGGHGLGVPTPEVYPHLQVAEYHPHHWEQVGYQEEYQVVSENT